MSALSYPVGRDSDSEKASVLTVYRNRKAQVAISSGLLAKVMMVFVELRN